MASVTADLVGGTGVRLATGNHTWVADEPIEVGGTDMGPNPYELLLSSLAACTAITISMYCQRQGWKLDSVSAKFHHEKVHAEDCATCADDHPDDPHTGYLDHIRTEIFIEGEFDDDAKERVRQVAGRCPVHRSLEGHMHFDEHIVVG